MLHWRPCWEPVSEGLSARRENLHSAVYQVTLLQGRRIPVLFLLLGYSEDSVRLRSPLCLISGSQWSTGRAGHLAA